MSDKPKEEKGHGEKGKDAKDEKGKDGEKKAKGPGLLSKTPVLLVVAMLLQSIVLFAGFKLFGGSPKAAVAEVTAESAEGDAHGEAKKDDAHGEAKKDDGHGEAKKDDGHGEAKKDDGHGEAKKDDGHGGTAAAAGHGKVDKKKKVELAVVDIRAQNRKSGQVFMYDVSIYVRVKSAVEEKTKSTLGDNSSLIKDRIRTIIAQSDPEKLGGGSEPGLETLRRQIKYQLDEIVGEGVIDEVLVPKCLPFPVN